MGPRQLAGNELALASGDQGVGEAISQCCSEQLGVGRAASEAGREAESRPCGGAEFQSGHGKLPGPGDI